MDDQEQDQELNTYKEEQPLDDERNEELAGTKPKDRLFLATTDSNPVNVETWVENLIGTTGIVQSWDTTSSPPTLSWSTTLNDYVQNNVSMRLMGSAIIASSAGIVYKLDANSGAEIQAFELTRDLHAVYTPMIVHKNLVIGVSKHRVVAIDRSRFKRVWKSSDLGDRFECLEIVANRLCVACDGEVSVVDIDTGQTIFSERFEGPRRAITLLKDETTDPTRPVCYVGFCGKIYVLDINGQSRLPAVLTVCEDNSFGVCMSLYRGLLLASAEGIVSAFDSSTLQEVWMSQFGHETGYSFMSTINPVRTEGKDVVVLGSNGYVVGVDAKTGTNMWITSLPRSGYNFVSTLLYNGIIYAATNGKLYGLEVATGNIQWSLALPGMGTHSIFMMSPEARNWMNSDTPILQAQGRVPAFSLFR